MNPEEKVKGSARGLSHKRPGSPAKASDKVRMDTQASQVRMVPVPLEPVSPPRPPSHPRLDPDSAQLSLQEGNSNNCPSRGGRGVPGSS